MMRFLLPRSKNRPERLPDRARRWKLGAAIVGEAAGAFFGDDPRRFLDALNMASSNITDFDQAAHGLGAYDSLTNHNRWCIQGTLVYNRG